MTNSTLIMSEMVNKDGSLKKVWLQQLHVIANQVYRSETSELSVLQLRRLIALELIKNKLPMDLPSEQDLSGLWVVE